MCDFAKKINSQANRNAKRERQYRQKHSSSRVSDIGRKSIASRIRGDDLFRREKSSLGVKMQEHVQFFDEKNGGDFSQKGHLQEENFVPNDLLSKETRAEEKVGIPVNMKEFDYHNTGDKTGKIPDNPVVNLARQCKQLGIKLIHGNLRIYQAGAMIPMDYDFFRRKLDQWITQRIIYVESYPTSNMIRDCYLHLLAVSEDDTDEYDIKFEGSKNLVAFANGTYNPVTGILRKHSIEDFIPFRVRGRYLMGEVCTPILDQIIHMQDTTNEFDGLRELFFEAIGYYFIANAAAKKFVYCAPRPDSGKSVLGRLLHSLFYPDTVSTEPINSLGEKFSQGDIWRKNICISMDLSDEVLSPKAVGRIKNLTGDPCVNTEEKYMPKRTSYHYCKYFFASNSPLKIRNYDEAFYNRVVILPFLRSIPREMMDMELQYKLIQEKDAIATLAARSLKHLIARNFDFPELKITKKLRAEWSGNYHEPLVEFIQMKCTLAKGEYTYFEDIYDSYCAYCDEFSFLPMEKHEFGKKLLQLYQGRIDSRKRRKNGGDPQAGYVGIALNQKDVIIPVRRDGYNL